MGGEHDSRQHKRHKRVRYSLAASEITAETE